jgi:diacylglycerol kinase family enzyme
VRALLIVNPNATSTTPAARDLLAHALESRVSLVVAHTSHRGHAAELAEQAAADGIDLIVVHGGDGTVNEAINGFLAPPTRGAAPVGWTPQIAVLPGGSANVFARSLGIAADPVDATNQLIDLIGAGVRRRIGLGYADKRWFTFNSGLGIDARVCESIDNSRNNGHIVSPSRYVRAAITEFFKSIGNDPTLTIECPDREPVDGVHYAFVSNSSPWTYMGTRPVHTNPNTSFDTGLGVFAMRSMGVASGLRVSRQLLAEGAEPKSSKLFRVDDVPRVRITAAEPIGFQMDGDYLGMREEVEFFSVPAAIEVVAPLTPA